MIIQNTYFKNKVSLNEQTAQKEDRFFRGRQIAYMIYDYFRVTGAHDTVCGQTLNDDGLVSVWFNDEDCPAYVRDAYFLNW